MKLFVRTVVALFLTVIAFRAEAQSTISVGNTPSQTAINASANWCNQESSPVTTVSSGTLSVPFDVLITQMSVEFNNVNITGSGWDGVYSQNGYHTGYSITGPSGATVTLMPVEWINYQCFFYQPVKNFEFINTNSSASLVNLTAHASGTQNLWWSDGNAYGYQSGQSNNAWQSYQSYSPFINNSSLGTWKLNVTAYDYEDGYWGPGCPTNVTVSNWQLNFQGTYAVAVLQSQTLFATANIDLGSSSTENIVVNNVGTRPLQVLSLNAIAGYTGDYSIAPSVTLPITIAAGGQALIPIIFTPKGVLSRAATFTLATTGLDGSVNPPIAQNFTVNMLGTGSAAIINAIFNNILFRVSVNVKDSLIKYFKIQNLGTKPLIISAFDKTQSPIVPYGTNGIVMQNFTDPNGNLTNGASDYHIVYPLALANNAQYTIPGGGVDSVGVLFSPTLEGSRSAHLILRSNGANVTTPQGIVSADSIVYLLQGVGLAAHFTTTYQNFGQVNLGDTAYTTIYVHNTGTGNLKFPSQALIEGNINQFKIFRLFHPPVLPDSVDSMVVMFTPDSLGFLYVKVGLLTNTPDKDSSKVIDLQGIGRPVAKGTFTPTTLFKGDTGEVGAMPITRIVSVKNTGTNELDVSSVAFVGTDSMNYTLITKLPLAVAVGATQQITFGFNPQPGHGGASSGTAVIYSNNSGGGANNISLLGYSCELNANPTPESLFVGVIIDTSSSQQDVVTLTNSGNCPILLTSVQITGVDANLYSLVPPIPTGIGPNDSVHVTVNFKPNRPTEQTPIASLRVTSNSKSDSVVTLPLLAKGCYFKVLSVPDTISVLFDHDLTTPINDTISASVLIDNTGCIPLIISGVTIDGHDANEYPAAKYPMNPIPPNVIDSVVFYFARQTPGIKVARARVTTNSNEIPYLTYYLGAPTSGVRSTGVTITDYVLYQNYPNPFNPTTHIDYDVAKSGVVKLEVLNALGQQVALIENSNMAAGRYTSTFDASTLPSGSYFYRLTTNDFTQTKVLNLIK